MAARPLPDLFLSKNRFPGIQGKPSFFLATCCRCFYSDDLTFIVMQAVEHNELFDLAFRFVTETSENIFLTGKAGTGKTTFLKYLKENSTRNIVVAAPTGVAAINAGGVTLHSLFQLPFHPFLPTKNHKDELLAKIRLNKQRQLLLRKMELLVIDEVSMVRSDVMDAIDTVLRSVRRNHRLPFGGVQVLCIGDLFQLPPVVQAQEWKILSEYYASPFFFDSFAIKELSPLLIELTKIYRQKEAGFVDLLNKVRNNQLDAGDFERLHARYLPAFQPGSAEKFITLTSHNNQADLINQKQLYQINHPAYTFKAVVEDEFPESMYPADYELVLKEGAQVMFLKNDVSQKRYFNGKIGIVHSLEKDKILVSCGEEEIEVRPETWDNTRYTLNRADGKLEQETLGRFTQYPLKLAWAITIHKSQGLTFDNVMVDASAAFSSGQVYVALSRCTSLEGVVLLNKIPPSAISSNVSVSRAQQSLLYKGSLPERFLSARRMFTQQLLEELFSFSLMADAAQRLNILVKEHYSSMNEGAVAWTGEFARHINDEQVVGMKFNAHISSLLKKPGPVEENPVLQKRITDAANHFIPRMEKYLLQLKGHPLSTESKEVAAIINEWLNETALAFYNAVFYLEYCRSPFSVTGFLQHKLKLAVPRFNLSCYAAETVVNTGGSLHEELLATLKRWRNMICAESGQPVYMVANQASLAEISTWLPSSKKDLMLIGGFGKAKVEKYGQDILEIVMDFCEKHGLETNMVEKHTSPKKEKKKQTNGVKADTKSTSLTLYKKGKKITEIAKERNLSVATVEGHLAHFIGTGELDISGFVSKEKQQQIKDVISRFGIESHKVLIENLPAGFSYCEVKMVIEADKVTGKKT